jgi:hypothetical protein
MRVRVKFRYSAETGTVEMFQVEDMQTGPRLADHDARHDRATAEVARVVENNALIEELPAHAPAVESRVMVTPEQQEHRQERTLRD